MVDNDFQLKIWKKISETRSLIPLKGKVPLEKSWQRFCTEKRTFQPDSFIGRDAGIACGPASNCLVLDVDDIDLFDVTCKNNGWSVPDTHQVRTGSGNIHYYFTYPQNGQKYGNKSFKKEGFDIRGLGGQVVAPGSIHPDTGKPYEVLKELDPAPAPQWILDLYEGSKEKINNQASALNWDDDIDSLPINAETKDLIKNFVPAGHRSEPMMTVLNAVVAAGLSDSDIFSIFELHPIGEKYREKGSSKSKWLQDQINKARKYVLNQTETVKNTSFDVPVDIFGNTTLAGKPEWSGEFAPEVIHNFAEDSAKRIGVDVQMIAMSAIVVSAAAIPDKFKIQPKNFDFTWTEEPRLWVAIVAEPGEKKTPAINIAMEPLKRLEQEFYRVDSKRLEAYEQQLTEYEKSKRKRGTGCPEKPKKPPQRRKIVDDTTIEALCDTLNENSNGVLSYNDELTGWFGAFDAYRGSKSIGKDRAAYLELYNGGPKFIDRVKKGRVLVRNWSACLLGGIQPGPMKRLMGKIDDDGLVQRFIPIFGGRQGNGQDRPPNNHLIEAYNQTITALAKFEPSEDYTIKFSPGAQKERAKVVEVVQKVMVLPDISPAFKAHLSKWDGLYPRLTLVFHMVETFAGESTVLPEFVSQKTAARAAKLMLDFLFPNAARFYSEILKGNDHLNDARWIAGLILSQKYIAITARDIYRAYKHLRRDLPGIRQAMEILTIAGWVKPLYSRNRQNPRKWNVNPNVHQIFQGRAEIERQHREEQRRKIRDAIKELGLSKSV